MVPPGEANIANYLQPFFSSLGPPSLKVGLAALCSPVNLLHTFRTPFPKNTSEGLLLWIERLILKNGRKQDLHHKKIFLSRALLH